MDEHHIQELSIFESPPADTTVQSREWIEYRPANQITEGSALEFNIAAQSSAYIDLKRSQLRIKLRITNEDDSPITEAEHAALVNLPLHSIFNQIDFSLQQIPISQLGVNYPYKAYIDTMLNTNASIQNNYLTSQMFYKDSYVNDDATINGGNGGLYSRSRHTANGKIADLEGPILLDLFQQDRLIVNGVALSLKLWPSRNAFRLMSESLIPSQKIQIVDASFKICLQKVNSTVLMAHGNMLKKIPAVYPYLRSEIKVASIASGQYSFSADDLFQGLVPNRLIVGLMASAGYSGNYDKSPFYFGHYDCNSLGVYVDGQSFPAKPLHPDYENDIYVDCYRTLATFRDDININQSDYKNGYCLYVLDINPYQTFNTKRRGHCRL